MKLLRRWVLLLCGFISANVVIGHVVDLRLARGRLVGDTIAFTVQISAADAARFMSPDARAPSQAAHRILADRERLAAAASQWWQLRFNNSAPEPPLAVQVEFLGEDKISFRLAFVRLGSGKVSFRAGNLVGLPRDTHELVTVEDQDGAARITKTLTAGDDTLEFQISRLGELSTKLDASVMTDQGQNPFRLFLTLGIEHIWTGYDHLLFLFGLLVVCGSFRSMLSIISCFTVAHSLTLGLATAGIVHVSSRLSEPAIAASIAFVGIENLLRRGREPRARWAVTFAFGLIHGLGFATALHDPGVGKGGTSIALPLFTFNLGVEIGQIAIAAIVLPVIWQLRKRDAFSRIGVPILSGIIAVAGAYWFAQRVFLH